MKSEKGQSLVETALVLPILCGVILMLVVTGDVFRRIEVIENAASEGGRAAQVWRVDGFSTCYQIVVDAVQRITPLDVNITVSAICGTDPWARIPSGQFVQVEVTHEWEPIFFSTLLKEPADQPVTFTYTAQVEDRHE